jgi:hypothetical protein
VVVNQARIAVDARGRIDLPMWAWKAILKKAGVRSKRYRVQKRVVKREFTRMVREVLNEGSV